jgi:Protein of unknown function (DUF2442)
MNQVMNKVISVKPHLDASATSLWVEMEDGREGVFDVAPYLRSDFFKELERPDYFEQVRIFFRGVGWPNGQDLGPDTISAELQELVVA